MTGCLLAEGVASISWNCLYHHLEYCIPITVSATLNWARMPAPERLDDPFPIFAFSSTVTRKPRSTNRLVGISVYRTPPTTANCAILHTSSKDYFDDAVCSFLFIF